MKNSLPTSEWIFVLSLLVFMGALLFVSKVNSYRMNRIIAIEKITNEKVSVTVTGAVAKPGKYTVDLGVTVGDILKKARPKVFANLEDLAINDLVMEGQNIDIKELSEIHVYVSGEVEEEQEVVLPLKSRICDLKSKIILTSNADKTFLRRKKLLKNGDQIVVPKKKLEKK